MKYIKCVVLTIILFSVSNSYSQQQGGYGWNCYHNGVFYTMVGANMACPNPDSYLNNIGTTQVNESTQNFGSPLTIDPIQLNGRLLKHDPNDHNCVITRVANSNH